jgi:hypothetical protein
MMMASISVTTIVKGACSSIKDHISDIYGWTGTIAVISAYALTSFEVEEDCLIDVLNIYGSISIGYVTYLAKVWQALACEVIWLLIASYSMYHTILEGKR